MRARREKVSRLVRATHSSPRIAAASAASSRSAAGSTARLRCSGARCSRRLAPEALRGASARVADGRAPSAQSVSRAPSNAAAFARRGIRGVPAAPRPPEASPLFSGASARQLEIASAPRALVATRGRVVRGAARGVERAGCGYLHSPQGCAPTNEPARPACEAPIPVSRRAGRSSTRASTPRSARGSTRISAHEEFRRT